MGTRKLRGGGFFSDFFGWLFGRTRKTPDNIRMERARLRQENEQQRSLNRHLKRNIEAARLAKVASHEEIRRSGDTDEASRAYHQAYYNYKITQNNLSNRRMNIIRNKAKRLTSELEETTAAKEQQQHNNADKKFIEQRIANNERIAAKYKNFRERYSGNEFTEANAYSKLTAEEQNDFNYIKLKEFNEHALQLNNRIKTNEAKLQHNIALDDPFKIYNLPSGRVPDRYRSQYQRLLKLKKGHQSLQNKKYKLVETQLRRRQHRHSLNPTSETPVSSSTPTITSPVKPSINTISPSVRRVLNVMEQQSQSTKIANTTTPQSTKKGFFKTLRNRFESPGAVSKNDKPPAANTPASTKHLLGINMGAPVAERRKQYEKLASPTASVAPSRGGKYNMTRRRITS
jgi:hypothetical protein